MSETELARFLAPDPIDLEHFQKMIERANEADEYRQELDEGERLLSALEE